MFEYIRLHSKKFMLILVVLIVPSFVLWGASSYQHNQEKSAVVAEINGLEIKSINLDSENSNRSNQFRDQLSTEFLNSAAFRYQTLEQMVNRESTRSLANKYLFTVGNAQLINYLESEPSYASLLTNGHLDLKKLKQLADNYGMSLADFENNLRYNLALEGVQTNALKSAIYSKKQQDSLLQTLNETYSIERNLYKAKDYLEKIKIEQPEIDEYYKNHQNDFLTKEKADIEYVVLDEASLMNLVNVNEDDLKNYYKQNIVNQKTKRKFSHILIKNSDNPKKTVQQLAQEILEQVKSAPDSFAEVAKKKSQEVATASKGGDFGWVNQGDLPAPIEKAVFSLDKGQIADQVVVSEYGSHIIKVTDVENQKSFEELKEQLTTQYKQEEARRIFGPKIDVLKDLVNNNPETLQPASTELGLKIVKADAVQKDIKAELTDEILSNSDFISQIFDTDSIKNQNNTQVVELASGKVVVGRVVKYYPSVVLPLADVTNKVSEQLKLNKATVLAEQEGASKLTELQKDVNSIKLTESSDVSLTKPAELTVAEMRKISLIGSSTKLPTAIGVAFDGGYSLIKILAVKPTDLNATDKRVQQMTLSSYMQKTEHQAYIKELQSIAKAKILLKKPDELEKTSEQQ